MRAPKYLSGLERALSRTTPERHFPSLIKSLKTFTKKRAYGAKGGGSGLRPVHGSAHAGEHNRTEIPGVGGGAPRC